ncbi:MAG: hypothetical protein V4710_18940, partial [Verrucomicrobiota bacterium]
MRTGLTFTGTNDITLSRPIEIHSGLARLDAITAGGNFIAEGPISGAGGLYITSSNGARVTLKGSNSYAGMTVLAGTAAIHSEAALGSGDLEIQGGTLILNAPWVSSRNLLFNGATIHTNGFTAVANGSWSSTGPLIKSGPGILRTTREQFLGGNIAVTEGAMEVAGDGAVRSPLFELRTGGTLLLDNTAIARSNRLTGAPSLGLADGELRLNGHATIPVDEKINVLSTSGSKGNMVSIATTGAPVILHATSINLSDGDLVIRGDGLGAAAGAPYSRVLLSTLPVRSGDLLRDIYAGSESHGPASSFAFYDTAIDAAGTVGLRPLRANEYSTGTIQNPLNGGTTAGAAHFLVDPGTIAIGAGNTIQSLTLNPSGSLALSAGQKLSITSGGILGRAGSAPITISGGSLILAPAAEAFLLPAT